MLIRLLRTYLRPYLREVAIVIVLVLIQSIANLYLPNLNADIINNGVAKGDIPHIWRTGAVMLGITLVLGVIAIAGVYWASRASMGVGRDLRAAVFGRVQGFSAREMNRFGTASLITRNTNDVQQIQLFMQIALTLMVSAPIMLVGGVFMALRTDVTLSGLLIVVIPLLAAIVGFMLWKAVPLFRSMQVKIDRINQVMREQIMGVLVILVPRAEASAARLQEVVTTTASIEEPTHPVEPSGVSGVVEFRGVTFGYPGGEKPVLQDLVFDLKPGETTAIIGGTGAGKTTLLNLIPRFFDVSRGAVLVDGVDVREQSLERLWSGIGLVPQRAYLFGGTIADNLRFGNEHATDDELWHALEVAQAR